MAQIAQDSHAAEEAGEDRFDKAMRRALQTLELATGLIVLVWYLDTLDHGNLSTTLKWRWENFKRRLRYDRRLRASEFYVIHQATEALEEASSDDRR